MKFRKFGKTVLTAALSSAIVFSLSSCVRSFTSGYVYVTGTVTAQPSGAGIISGFKINNNNGKLTAMDGLPVASGGANPVRAVLLTGGNFVYVLNRGANSSGGSVCTATIPCENPNITEFAVGGNGILTPQNTFYTQGFNPIRLISDSTGAYLLALDQVAPGTTDPTSPSNSTTNQNAYCKSQLGTPTCGDITVFSINSTTGRLSLVTNAQLTSSTGSQVTYFPVPTNPIDFTMASGYVMTLAGTPSASPTTVVTTPALGQTVYPYTYNSTNGQLSESQSTVQYITNGLGNPVGQGTAIVYASAKIYILDNEILANGVPGQILPYTVGTNGALQSLVGGAVADDASQTNPVYLMAESKAKYLYVANQQGANINDGAGIVAYVIDPTSSQLSEDSGSPFLAASGTGASPQCILEDPSNQYIYTANAGDSTVTGRVLDPNSGALTPMQGWPGQIGINGPATWCVVTGRTN